MGHGFSRSVRLRALTALIFLLAVICLPLNSWAGTFTAFGPEPYTRGSGSPVVELRNFNVLNPGTTYTLEIHNGGLEDSEVELVSSSVIGINGVQVVGPNEFNQNVTYIEKPVSLNASNELSVELRGKPGGSITILVIGVDNDPPTITAALSSQPNSAGWHNQDVTVTFMCSDATSGVAACPAPVTVSAEGVNQIITGTATDMAGNTASVSVSISLDKTPPSLSGTVSPAPNAQGWNNTGVTVSFTCTDALSGIAGCTVPVTVSTEGAGQVITGTATDLAGNTSSADVTLNIDATPPVISITGVTNGQLTNQDITPLIITTDLNPGTDTITLNSQLYTNGTVITGDGTYTLSVSSTDVAGNTATSTTSFTIDKTPPVVSITLPANNSTVNTATTGVSGSIDDNTATVTIDGINATVSAGTFSADIQLTEGANTVTATATDPVGNQAATSVNITLDTVAPDAVDPNQVAISEVSTGFVNVSGAAGSAEPSATVTVTVTNSRTAVTAATAAAADGSFSVDISALDGDLLYIVVTDAAGNSSGATSVTVSIGGAGTLIQYEYDANGNRVRKIKTGN